MQFVGPGSDGRRWAACSPVAGMKGGWADAGKCWGRNCGVGDKRRYRDLTADALETGGFTMKFYSFSTALRAMILLSAGIFLQGCNTTEGFGKDMSVAGQAVTDAAQENNTY